MAASVDRGRSAAQDVRLFLAVWPPASVQEAIGALARPAAGGVRWTAPEQWHVTLRFLGGVPAGDVAAVVAAVEGARWPGVVAEVGPATGRFGQRVLHVPVGGLERLAEVSVAATGRFGRPPERRPYRGHLTLARGRPGADLRPLEGVPIAASWPVDEIALVRSDLRPSGPRYEVLARVPTTPPSLRADPPPNVRS